MVFINLILLGGAKSLWALRPGSGISFKFVTVLKKVLKSMKYLKILFFGLAITTFLSCQTKPKNKAVKVKVPEKKETLKKYRYNRNGVRAISKKTDIEIYGALDDLWLNKDTDEIVVLDYKATSNKKLEDYTSSDKHYHKSYLRQLDFYAYLLRLKLYLQCQ